MLIWRHACAIKASLRQVTLACLNALKMYPKQLAMGDLLPDLENLREDLAKVRATLSE